MAPHPISIERTHVVEALSALRQDWEQSTGDESLVDVQASFGLLLFDVAEAVGLTLDEQLVALGPALMTELQAMELVAIEGINCH